MLVMSCLFFQDACATTSSMPVVLLVLLLLVLVEEQLVDSATASRDLKITLLPVVV